MTFYEKVMELIEQKGISQRKMLLDLELNTNSFVNWKKRGTLPTAKTLTQIAKYFCVPIQYFLDTSYVLENLLKEIKKQKLTQKAVLEELNLSPMAFVDWKRGKSNSYIKYLPSFAEILNVPILSLINEDDYGFVEATFWKVKKNETKILFCRECGFYIQGLCIRKKLYTPFPPTGFCNYAVARSDSECEQCSKCIKNDVCVFKVDNNGECLYFAGKQ